MPSDLAGPLFFDMATSAAAAGKVLLAVARGKPVPDGWVIDADGRPTTDPRKLRQGGALLPLGGAEGYKGYGLAAIVEIFSGLLTGLGFGIEPTGRHNDGCFIAVFKVSAFRDLATFRREVTEFAHYLKETPPAEGFERVYYPGEVEWEREQERRANGIPIEDATWEVITKLANETRLRGGSGPVIGRNLRRLEDARFLTGEGRYIDDITLHGMLHAVVVRSPHAHADIETIDTNAARGMAGVRGVFTAADLAPDRLGSIPCTATVATLEPMIVPARPALAADRVRHVGEPVAFVVADSLAAAREAAEQVVVAYGSLPAVTDGMAAIQPGAPLLWPEMAGNVSYRFQKGDRAAVDAAFAQAGHVTSIELVNNRVIIAAMETRGAIGVVEDGVLHLMLSGAGVHGIRDALADIFHVPRPSVRVSAPDVGGGFGIKNAVYPEHILLLWAARRLNAPVKWIADRAEDFASTAQGRDNHTRGRLALDKDGRLPCDAGGERGQSGGLRYRLWAGHIDECALHRDGGSVRRAGRLHGRARGGDQHTAD